MTAQPAIVPINAPAGSIDWHRFLARPRLPSPSRATLERLSQASILVTGAGGSIGQALSLRLAALHPAKLRLMDASEQALDALRTQLAKADPSVSAKLVLGNCGDPALLDEILEPRQLIFHAAAYKHVPLLEEHPLQAIANNALATHTLSLAASRRGAARVVLLSTDKAAAPASILGASKRIAERVVMAQQGVALRLANVLGTTGSVSEIFTRQIASGAPLSITTPDARRFFLTCAEAVDLLLSAALAAPPASLLAPRLDAQHPIASLAQFLNAELSPKQLSPTRFTGPRPGDKPGEVFWSSEETASPSAIEGLLTIAAAPGESLDPSPLLASLADALRSRDLPRAIACVQQLVPAYRPSETILAQIRPTEVRQ